MLKSPKKMTKCREITDISSVSCHRHRHVIDRLYRKTDMTIIRHRYCRYRRSRHLSIYRLTSSVSLRRRFLEVCLKSEIHRNAPSFVWNWNPQKDIKICWKSTEFRPKSIEGNKKYTFFYKNLQSKRAASLT